jgi:hypothetical protein
MERGRDDDVLVSNDAFGGLEQTSSALECTIDSLDDTENNGYDPRFRRTIDKRVLFRIRHTHLWRDVEGVPRVPW